MPGACPLLAAISLCWLAASSLWIYPHSLSYFNESVGGPLNGPEHLLGINVDWGQDIRYVQSFAEKHADGTLSNQYLVATLFFRPIDLGVDVLEIEELRDNRQAYLAGPGLYFTSVNHLASIAQLAEVAAGTEIDSTHPKGTYSIRFLKEAKRIPVSLKSRGLSAGTR